MNARNILYLILILFGIATAMAIQTAPYRTPGAIMSAPRDKDGHKPVAPDIGTPDENQHANYIAHLLDGKGFPVLHVGNGDEIEFHQPPLSYVIYAGAAKVFGWDPKSEAGRNLRYLNVLAGMGTLVAIYFAALWGLKREDIALVATAIAGLMPMFVGIHSGVNNDPLLILICSWVFALCVHVVSRSGAANAAESISRQGAKDAKLADRGAVTDSSLGLSEATPQESGDLLSGPGGVAKNTLSPALSQGEREYPEAIQNPPPWGGGGEERAGGGVPSTQQPRPLSSQDSDFPLPKEGDFNGRVLLLIGVLLGLGLLTKSSALALFPVVILTGWWLKDRTGLIKALSPVLIGLIIAAPWLMRNQSLYGDPLALKLFEDAFKGSPHTADMVAGLGATTYWTQWFGWWTARSFVGVFGYMDIFFSDTVYRLALAVMGIMAAGWVFSFREKEEGDSRKFHILGGVLFVIVALLFLKFNLTYFQAQARYLYPAIAPIAIGLATGLMYLVKRRDLLIPAGLAVALFIGNVVANGYVGEQFQVRLDEAKASQTAP